MWSFRSPSDDSWISDAFARETEALTKALQMSLSNADSLSPSSPSSLLLDLIKPEPAAPASQPDSGLKRAGEPAATGRISKRKTRASKRCPTTYINADPANFRQMVQQVTGVRLSDAKLPDEPVLKPEPQRAGGSAIGLLPTLDTSAFLLDRAWVAGPEPGELASVGPAVDGLVGFEFDPFPTLESWGVL